MKKPLTLTISQDQIDRQQPKLNFCCLVMYVNCNMIGQMWSISPAFVMGLYFKKIDVTL